MWLDQGLIVVDDESISIVIIRCRTNEGNSNTIMLVAGAVLLLLHIALFGSAVL
jgi:hypothetical protein